MIDVCIMYAHPYHVGSLKFVIFFFVCVMICELGYIYF